MRRARRRASLTLALTLTLALALALTLALTLALALALALALTLTLALALALALALKAYACDKKLQQLLAEQHKGFAQLFADAGGVLVAPSGAGGASVSLAGFLGVCTKRGLLGERTLRNTAVGVTPPPDGRKKHFKVSLSKTKTLTITLTRILALALALTLNPNPRP